MEEKEIEQVLHQGARNAVATCLKVQAGEQAVLIYDQYTTRIAYFLRQALEEANARIRTFLLEEFTPRPMARLPEEILAALRTANVSLYTARALSGELTARMEMMAVVNQQGIRHGHMVNISEKIMMQGMQADFELIDRLSEQVLAALTNKQHLRVTAPGGTDLSVVLSPRLKWIKTSGLISPQKWGNLPGGEVFTSPFRVDGRLVVDGVVGDYLCQKYGVLDDRPLVISIHNSRITAVESQNKELEKEFSLYVQQDANGDRVGEFAIGTNIAVKALIGEILQDEKLPTVHLAFGHPYSEHTGQTWSSGTHIDCVIQQASVFVDDEPLMRDGSFNSEKLGLDLALLEQ